MSFLSPDGCACSSFSVASSFESCFMNVLSRLLFARKELGSNPVFMDAVVLLKARAPKYNDHALVCIHCYNHVVTSRLGPAIGFKDMRILI